MNESDSSIIRLEVKATLFRSKRFSRTRARKKNSSKKNSSKKNSSKKKFVEKKIRRKKNSSKKNLSKNLRGYFFPRLKDMLYFRPKNGLGYTLGDFFRKLIWSPCFLLSLSQLAFQKPAFRRRSASHVPPSPCPAGTPTEA
jgi:hypothetical protein